jgi:serine/threonine protein kinase
LQELFDAALSREPGLRAAFLAEACGDDEAIRNEVLSLLAAHDEAGSFIERAPLRSSEAAGARENAPGGQEGTLRAGTRLGPYEIVTFLGAGGMGEVYRARDVRLARVVAIKLLAASFAVEPDRLRRFDQEARAVAALNHPNIVALHDLGSHEGCPFLVLEQLEGESLRERLQWGPLPPAAALDAARQIARGLAAAHEKGILHRDLKPENLFLTANGPLKILDFGLAKAFLVEPTTGHVAEAREHTKSGIVLGTAGYMSPEQVRGLPADARSDIFSFGAIFYEMLTGRRAFPGPSSPDALAAILREQPPLTEHDEAVPGVNRLIAHCLEKDPHLRCRRKAAARRSGRRLARDDRSH